MNERIKQLWSEAAESNFGDSWEEQTAFMSKFAELIVQECINIVDEQKECLHEEQKYWHDRDYGYALAVDDASKGIKQHFGVEE
jgi:hypothetical protein